MTSIGPADDWSLEQGKAVSLYTTEHVLRHFIAKERWWLRNCATAQQQASALPPVLLVSPSGNGPFRVAQGTAGTGQPRQPCGDRRWWLCARVERVVEHAFRCSSDRPRAAPATKGAHRVLCTRCAKSQLFSTTGSHGSQGPEFCNPDAVLNGSCMLL